MNTTIAKAHSASVTEARTLGDLQACALVLSRFDGSELAEFDPADMGACALEYAANGWEVFPLSAGKLPYKGSHGVLDASSDLQKVAEYWSGIPQTNTSGEKWRGLRSSNIGARIPEGLVVLDIDPRSGGLETWEALVKECGAAQLSTLTTLSGRGDGGQHRYYFAPPGKLSQARLNAWAAKQGVGKKAEKSGLWISGIDLKTRGGYCLLPPSIHPKTNQPYRFQDPEADISPGSLKLWEILLQPEEAEQIFTSRPTRHPTDKESPADYYSRSTAWGEILEGWRLVSGDGESDGSKWKAPTAEHAFSGTIKNGLLFNYSNSVAEFGDYVTEGGTPRGITKFRAYALLNYHGDLSAAAKDLLQVSRVK